MNPVWRERLFAIATCLLAVWLSINLASGALGWPIAAAVVAGAVVLVQVTNMSFDVIVLGGLLIGYIVGNRGFAQLMPVPGLPLLPGEAGLAIAGAWFFFRCALTRSMPWRRDALNHALLAWIILGTARFAFDAPRFGLVALRDFAMVYYAGFFFITQAVCADERCRRFLLRSLLVAGVILPVAFVLSEVFPVFFLTQFTVNGTPLVYFKGDLAPAFLAVSGILLFIAAPVTQRWWARPLATLMVLWVIAGDNRASMVGLVTALLWIGVSRFRWFSAVQGMTAACALLILIGVAALGQNTWAENKLASLTDRVRSVLDVQGRFTYQSEESSIKSDNNQFRWVWWRSVAAETLAENPALGLGFGHDLARGFLQEYNPELSEDFTARSPHSILVTSLGRMGLVGLLVFCTILVLLAGRTWRVIRDPASDARRVALWAALWPIAVSACFGVVLEGPMGAIVFWTLLGLAHAYPATVETDPEPAAEKPALVEAPVGAGR